jgi:hypothetical protein
MHLHLSNCHGEWAALAALAVNLPLVVLWVRVTVNDYFGGE